MISIIRTFFYQFQYQYQYCHFCLSIFPYQCIVIHSICEDSPLLSFFFWFSLLMLCACCMLRDWYMSHCVAITICSKQQRPCILVHNTHATQEESAGSTHSATFEFSLLAHILQMLLGSKINSHISLNFCPDHQDGGGSSKL